MKKSQYIPNDNCITKYLYCRQCREELPAGMAPKDYAQLTVGFSKVGLQVWCVRHDLNVMHMDFEGYRHPANLDIHTAG